MDAFYASIEQRDRPELRGLPVVVGGDPRGRGVVAAASYEARRHGVRSAMPCAQAHRLCPRAVFLRPRIADYSAVGEQAREIMQRFTPLVEPLSLDEAFLDVTGSRALFGSGETIGRKIKSLIREELDLVASVGVAENKFLAKIASDLDKPDGFTVVPPDGGEAFLAPLPVRRLWGIGRKAEAALSRLGISTIGELRGVELSQLRDLFGEQGGRHLHQLARGQDDREVIPDHQAISISHETTFPADINDPVTLLAVLRDLTEQVARRLRQQRARAGGVRLKVRYSDFRTITRSQKLAEPTDQSRRLWDAVSRLFEERLPGDETPPIRLLGMGATSLIRDTRVQKSLFEDEESVRERQLDSVRDAIVERYGGGAVFPGSSLERHPENERNPPPE
jgi:DNA polymerase IV